MMNSNIQRNSYPPRARVPRTGRPPIGYPNLRQQPPGISKIRDYLFWSIINICIGGLIPGLIAVLFSYFTREKKRENNLIEARKWSKRALVCNILTTVLGILFIIALVVGLAVGLGVGVSSSSSSSYTNSSSSSSGTVSCICAPSGNSISCSGACIGSCKTATSCSGCTAACNVGVVCTTGSIVGSC